MPALPPSDIAHSGRTKAKDAVRDQQTMETPRCWLEDIHDFVVMTIIDSCDLRTRMAVLCTCRRMRALCERPDLWRRVVFDSADQQRGLKAERLLSVLGRARGGVEVLRLARTPEARDAEREQRFSDGLKVGQLLRHTLGAGALRLAALAPRLRHLSIDERASCLGGMTDDLARALGARCPALERLEVFFGRYSLPAELFGDDGLIALTEGCRALKALVLVNVDGVSDRCLYAVAANCRGLRELVIGGYSESITDAGLGVLVEAARELRVLRLGGKLLKATDATLHALARGGGGGGGRNGGGVARPLERIQLTRGMTMSGALRALAACCPSLTELDARHALTAAELGGGGRAADGDDEDAAALAALARACPRLSRVALPPVPQGGGDDEGGGGSGSLFGVGGRSSVRVSSSGSGSGDVDDDDDDNNGVGGSGSGVGGSAAGDLAGWRIASLGAGAHAGSCVLAGGGNGSGSGVRLLQAADVAALVAQAAGR